MQFIQVLNIFSIPYLYIIESSSFEDQPSNLWLLDLSLSCLTVQNNFTICIGHSLNMFALKRNLAFGHCWKLRGGGEIIRPSDQSCDYSCSVKSGNAIFTT